MLLQVSSDLHLEKTKDFDGLKYITPSADITCIAW